MMVIMMMMMMIMMLISFWIKPEAVPARVTLGVTSLLTLSTQHANSQKSLPPVSYIKVTSSSSIMAAVLHCTCPCNVCTLQCKSDQRLYFLYLRC